MGGILAIGFIIVILIWAKIEDYKEIKAKTKYNYLSGRYKHRKTPKGIITEVERIKRKKKTFGIATFEELQHLKITKYMRNGKMVQ